MKCKKYYLKNGIVITVFIIVLIYLFKTSRVLPAAYNPNEEIAGIVQQIFTDRNRAMIDENTAYIQEIYDRNTKYGTWAYEYEIKKMKYLHNWEVRQGVKFVDIIPTVVVRSVKGNPNRYSINLICSTEYKYVYEGEPGKVNSSRIGTYHIISLSNNNGEWIITKEWYKDPFADSLKLDNLKDDSIKQFILLQQPKDLSSIGQRRIKAVEYADKYCGAASKEEFGYKYNKKYRNYNSQGGDCANFASQILYEGGGFRKTSGWNYDKNGATRSWLNADGFKRYMINSGRASVISYGSYEKVFKASYSLMPGDFIAYEKNKDITHISVVTGSDSMGYALVSCHNTDRNNVPWDLGWSDKSIKFWLVRVHY
jgi:hypothetical protein